MKTSLENSYQGGWNGKHDVLLLKSIGAPRGAVIYNIGAASGYTIKWEKAEGPPLDDWRDYADWLALMALNNLLNGNTEDSVNLYRELLGMWDGYGFRDKAWSGEYEVYKLALAVYLHRALQACGYFDLDYEAYNRWVEIIAGAQRSDGGFRTHYKVIGGSVVYTGDANTETTSMVVLALFSDYPESVCKDSYKHDYNDLIAPFLALVIVARVVAFFKRI